MVQTVLTVPEEGVEPHNTSIGHSSVLFDEESRTFKLWYTVRNSKHPDPAASDGILAMAESTDGETFRKVHPNLGPAVGGPSVFIDANAPPERRFNTVGKCHGSSNAPKPCGEGTFLAWSASPTGVKWTPQ
eukprot:COSAG04_NODE_2635_length_3827_cov_4.261534_5_plen_131_part_00